MKKNEGLCPQQYINAFHGAVLDCELEDPSSWDIVLHGDKEE
jgi:hypothetical protein